MYLADMTTMRASDVVGQRIREARAARDWSAKDLAARCAAIGAPDITAAVIANIETGRRGTDGHRRRDVTVDELLTLAYAFEVSPADLLGGENSSRGNVAITSNTAASAGDVAAWIAGTTPTPVPSLLEGGFARCGTCGHPIWSRREVNAVGEGELIYYCSNAECPQPAVRRGSLIDEYLTEVMIAWVRQYYSDIFKRMSLAEQRAMIHGLLRDVTLDPVQQPDDEETLRESVHLDWIKGDE